MSTEEVLLGFIAELNKPWNVKLPGLGPRDRAGSKSQFLHLPAALLGTNPLISLACFIIHEIGLIVVPNHRAIVRIN